MFLLSLYIFILGLLIGSFLNVCIYRIPKNQSIAYPPSHCTECGKKIKPYDLIPIISYVFLKGKCRNCSSRIPIRYLLIELLTGLIFILLFYRFNFSIEFIKFAILSSILVVVTFIDFEYSIIPGKIMIFTFICGIILNILGNKLNANLLNYLYGFLLGGGLIFLIVFLTGGMGGGDIQLMAVIGLYIGLKYTVLTLLLSFIIGASAGVLLIILKKKTRKDYIPFGPWISLAAIISILLGESIINWYISLL